MIETLAFIAIGVFWWVLAWFMAESRDGKQRGHH